MCSEPGVGVRGESLGASTSCPRGSERRSLTDSLGQVRVAHPQIYSRIKETRAPADDPPGREGWGPTRRDPAKATVAGNAGCKPGSQLTDPRGPTTVAHQRSGGETFHKTSIS